MSVKREDVLKYLEEANMIEISELVKDIEDKFGVTAAVPVAAAAAGAAEELLKVKKKVVLMLF